MRIILLALIIILDFPFQTLKTQTVYSQSSGEFIFGFSNVSNYGTNIATNLRFTCFFHTGQYWHFDFTNNLGSYTGLAIRNVGFITKDDPIEHVDKVKRRSYTLGIPIAFKLGSFKDNLYLYGGGEYEWLFHYKEKRFTGNNKQKITEWFSQRTNRFLPSIFAGIQFPKGINLRFKYYLKNFMNTDYTDTSGNKPYFNLKSQVLYLSLCFNYRNNRMKKKVTKKETDFAMFQ